MKAKLNELRAKIERDKDLVKNEAQVESAFVEPFLSEVLGYKTSDMKSVQRQYSSGFGYDKGVEKKVDYAILSDETLLAIIEVKHCKSDKLDYLGANKKSPKEQLAEYFTPCAKKGCKFGILTNGVEYRFFSDLERENIMDDTPFLTLNLERNLNEKECEILALFKNGALLKNVEKIKNSARQESEISRIKERLKGLINGENDKFLGLFKDIIGVGNLQPKTKARLQDLVKQAFEKLVADEKGENHAEFSENLAQNGAKFSTNDDAAVFKLIKSLVNSDKIDFVRMQNYINIGIKNDEGKINGKNLLCRVDYIKKRIQIGVGANSKHKLKIINESEIRKFQNELKGELKRLLG